MSYDYNSQDARFDIKNPYRVENFIYFCAGGVLAIGSIILLLISRHSLGSGSFAAMSPLFIGIIMLVDAAYFGAKAMSRLRFFFGRDQPVSLSRELAPDQVEAPLGADKIKNHLRQSSLKFSEPRGPLNGLLYSLVPGLIYSPRKIQALAQRQFQNALAFGVTLLSLLVSTIGANAESVGWIGLGFFIMALVVLILPHKNNDFDEDSLGADSGLGLKWLVVLVLIAILGPVFVPMLARGHSVAEWLPGGWQAAFVLLAFEVGIAVFFVAVIKQSVVAAPQASVAMVQGTVTMNSHPKQVIDELERRMQEQWVALLPNRRYCRVLPEISGATGSFSAELLEETQPVFQSGLKNRKRPPLPRPLTLAQPRAF